MQIRNPHEIAITIMRLVHWLCEMPTDAMTINGFWFKNRVCSEFLQYLIEACTKLAWNSLIVKPTCTSIL